MKKFVSLLLAAALIAVCASGCDREEKPVQTLPPTQAPTQGVQQVELELPEDRRPYLDTELTLLSHLGENDPRSAVLEQAAEVFRARTGAAVKFIWLDGDDSRIEGELAGDAGVDIFSVTLDDLYADHRYRAMDLTELAAAHGYENHSHDVLRRQVVERMGALAAIPQEPLLYGMYYNADYLDDAGVTEYPDTWADFLELSAHLTEEGYKPLTIDSENAHLILELHLERQLGRETFEDMMRNARWRQDAAYPELFRLSIDYAAAGFLAKGDPAAFPGGQDKLALSNVAMAAGSNLICRQVEESTMMDVSWGVFPYPGDGPGRGFGVESRVLAIPRSCPDAQAAFDFIMLLTTGEFDQLYADVSLGIPADPENACEIRGAMELLEDADTDGFGFLKPEHNELFTRLWNGWYKTPSYFAGALNELARAYKAETPEGVG